MNLERALLCVELDCQEVFEAGYNNSCPACGNSVFMPVARVFNRPATEVRRTSPKRGHLTLVPPPSNAVPVTPPAPRSASRMESAEIADFRRFLEERMPEIEKTTEIEAAS